MAINLQSVLDTIKDILKNAYTKDSPAVKKAIDGYIKDAQDTFSLIAQGVAAGKLSYNFVVARLKDEEINIKDRLISLGQIALADLEQLAKDAITIFELALKEIVGN